MKDICISDHFMMQLFFFYSFGQPAIFLLGGSTKETRPIAMYIESGDIVVMSGPARLAYHAVPKILQSPNNTLPECFTLNVDTLELEKTAEYIKPSDDTDTSQAPPGAKPKTECCHKCEQGYNECVREINTNIIKTLKTLKWDAYCDYLKTSRINMNVRQVLKPGQQFPRELTNEPAEINSTISVQDCPDEKIAKLDTLSEPSY